jgi:hypothetical protein
MNNIMDFNDVSSNFKKKIKLSKAILLNNFLNEDFSTFQIDASATKYQSFMDAVKIRDE